MPADPASPAGSLGVDLTARQLDQLSAYADRLATSAHNLTSARDRDQIDTRHIDESLAFGHLLAARGLLPDAANVLDLGAGGGLPGIPLRIAWPGIRLTLLESVGKKCRFLEQTTTALSLDHVTVVEGRAEDFGRDSTHRETYDLALARAVAPLPVLLEYALPALRVGGWLAAPKGSAATSELAAAANALDALGGRLDAAAPFRPPDGLPQTVIVIEKVAPAPARYPRRAGIPSKRPL
jgi:16S rRNA (guanine527-N7)-methyltransferase